LKEENDMKKMNLPNMLSLLRCLLVPVFVVALIFMRDIPVWRCVVPSAIYGLTAITDMLDGKIARKYNLVTDFGKFIDPLADKFMVLGSMLAIIAWMLLLGEQTLAVVYVFTALLILLRELGVTSIRLVVAGKEGIVVAASMLGKIKTVSQMIGTVLIIMEPAFAPLLGDFAAYHPIAYVSMAVMAFTTVFSGIDYLKAYLPYIDSNK
jgi:CDP-diacylglycerol--glycerol-3-phosphate 3-phosphatidyltransferase